MLRTKHALFVTFFLSLAALLFAPTTQAQNGPFPRHITATGDAVVFAPPDAARVTISFEQTASKVADALQLLDETQQRIASAIAAISPQADLALRGNTISQQPNLAKVERTVAFDSRELSNLGKTIDAALAAGPAKLLGAEYRVQDAEKIKEEGVVAATLRAKRKADKLAATLGLQVGLPLSATISEEGAGTIFRNRIEAGEPADQLHDEEYRIVVTADFELHP